MRPLVLHLGVRPIVRLLPLPTDPSRNQAEAAHVQAS
jgi:hypothetical protein